MKFPVQFVAVVLTSVIAVASFAGNEPASGCKPLGSWLGYDQAGSAWWMTTTMGKDASHGTLNLEVPGAVVYFPGAFSVTEMRGVWKKIGPNSVAWTVVGFAYDAAGNTLALARVSGKHSSSKDCMTEYLTDTFLEVFAPDADIDSDDPIGTTSFPDHEGHRIKLVIYDLP